MSENIIHYKDVEIRQEENVVLKHVTFDILKGEFIYLFGKVGSGKSSLMKSMYAELPLALGEAQVMDYDLRHLKRKDIPLLRRRLGIIFQDFKLLNDRCVEANLEFVLRATGWHDKKRIQEQIDLVLTTVGMQKKGYKRPHQLSGGEQQRIVIARALLNSPDIILADEPTGNLDNDTANELIELLHSISEGGTSVIVATHNIGLADKIPGKLWRCENEMVVVEE